MKSKEVDIDRMYLIYCPNRGYYHHDLYDWTENEETAARFSRKEAAEAEARKLNGIVYEDVLTQESMCYIITAKKRGDCGGKFVRTILEEMNSSMDSICYKQELTLGGKKAALEEILFTAAGRYADILYSANCVIESYYTLIASDNYYQSYDPERDNMGMLEYEVSYQLIQMYEEQLKNIAFLYQIALTYLKRALMHRTGQKNADERSEVIISLFSDTVIMAYQKNPEKCFEQFKKIEDSVPYIYELTGKNGR